MTLSVREFVKPGKEALAMKRSRWLIVAGIIVGLAILGIAAFMVFGSSSDSRFVAINGLTSTPVPTYPATWTPAPIRPEQEISTSEVIVALQPIPRGAQFVEGSIGRRPWPADNVPPDTIQDEVETIGMVAKTEIVPGQIVVRSMLVPVADAGEASFSDNYATSNYVVQAQQRVIIYAGEIWLVVKDTQEAVAAITELAEEMGGYVSASNLYQSSNNVLQGNITIRVPSERYQETLAALRALALRVEREEAHSQDVTEEFIDLEARLSNLEAGEEAVQKLLGERQQVADISEIAAVQQKLAEIRSQVEQTEGRLRYLTDQAALSTINIELIPEQLPPTPTPTPTPLPGWEPGTTAREASRELVFSLQEVINSLIWGVIYGLPLLIVYLIPVALVLWLIRWGWRHYKAKKLG
jgi:hypothetical protein